MTKQDIIRIAQDAGLHIATDVKWMPIIGLEYAEKFAALVASAEREACAKVVDAAKAGDIAKSDDKLYRRICQNHQKKRWHILSGDEVDEAIRARGDKHD